MELFELRRSSFDGLPEFNEYLGGEESPVENDLHIVAGLSQYSEEEFLDILLADGFEVVDEFGAIIRIQKDYTRNDEDFSAGFYLHFHEAEGEGGVILLYTNQRKTKEITHTIQELLETEHGLYYLHVGPRLFQIVRDEVLQREDLAEITEFVADRRKGSDRPARIRPGFERTISYYGEDGWDSLREVEENYGVRPRYIQFNVPNVASFKITREGVFSLDYGSLDNMFHYVETCIRESLSIKRAFDASNFRMVNNTQKLSIPTAEPAIIDLTTPMQYEDLNNVKSKMDDEDYFIVDSFGQEGSVHFSSKIYDKKREHTFRLKATDHTIRVFPQNEEGDLGSFLRFHEFVQNHIDPEAEAIPP